MTLAPLRRSSTSRPVEHAFAPTVLLEPWVGGPIYERTAAGLGHEWGEVTVWEPRSQLGYRWHLRRDRDDVTDVEIRFVAVNGTTTRVDITHSGWERLGAGGADWRERNQAGGYTLWRTT